MSRSGVREALDGFTDIPLPGMPKQGGDPEPEPEQASDYYPGSKKKRRAVAPSGTDNPVVDNVQVFRLTHRGESMIFYTLGVLAEALERVPQTLRKWENLGYIPHSDFRTPGRNGHGKKRLYTKAQIDGIIRIAGEEGLIGDSNRNVSATNFPSRVQKLFKELAS